MGEPVLASQERMKHYRHLNTTLDQQNYLWIQLNVEHQSCNILASEVLDELMSVCAKATQTPTITALILTSTKPQSFIASYHLEQLQALRHKQAAVKFAQHSQELVALLQRLPFPVIAVVAGATTGAGIELALACDAIIALNQEAVNFTYHDLALGLTPVMSGLSAFTQRMGTQEAWEWLLKDQTLTASQAYEAGLIDHIIADNSVLLPLLHQLIRLSKTQLIHQQNHKRHWVQHFNLLKGIAIKRLIEDYYPDTHYTAPQRLLADSKRHAANPKQRLLTEAQTFADLVLDAPSVHLVYLEQAYERLEQSLPAPFASPPTVAIIGASPLGQYLACALLQQGCTVTFRESSTEQRQKAEASIKQMLVAQTSAEMLPEYLQRLLWVKNAGLLEVDIVLETIADQLRAKQELLAELEETTPDTTLLITTSLCHKLADLVAPMLQPQRVTGIHLFCPLTTQRLVEVLHLPTTPLGAIERTLRLMRLIDKLPLILSDQHYFVGYRILIMYLFQGMRLQQQGVPVTTVDQAAREFGMRYGPLELADYIGLDTCLQLGELAKQQLGLEIPASLRTMVANSKLGRKNQNGFYRYRQDRILKTEREQWTGNMEQMKRKLVKQMVEEARICLELGLIEDASLLDLSVVEGSGFPAFRGGPIRYATHPLGAPQS